VAGLNNPSVGRLALQSYSFPHPPTQSLMEHHHQLPGAPSPSPTLGQSPSSLPVWGFPTAYQPPQPHFHPAQSQSQLQLQRQAARAPQQAPASSSSGGPFNSPPPSRIRGVRASNTAVGPTSVQALATEAGLSLGRTEGAAATEHPTFVEAASHGPRAPVAAGVGVTVAPALVGGANVAGAASDNRAAPRRQRQRQQLTSAGANTAPRGNTEGTVAPFESGMAVAAPLSSPAPRVAPRALDRELAAHQAQAHALAYAQAQAQGVAASNPLAEAGQTGAAVTSGTQHERSEQRGMSALQ
jgi:hypothetical protein